MRRIVGECMNININIRVESIAQCDDVLSANAGQLITVHMGQLPSVTANLSEITLYKYTVVQNANTNTQMYRVQIQIQTARCTHVPWQGVSSVPFSIQWTIDVQKQVIWEMSGQYKYNAVCAQGVTEREIDQCTAVSHKLLLASGVNKTGVTCTGQGTITSTCTSGARAVTGTPHRAGSCLWCPPTPLLCI